MDRYFRLVHLNYHKYSFFDPYTKAGQEPFTNLLKLSNWFLRRQKPNTEEKWRHRLAKGES